MLHGGSAQDRRAATATAEGVAAVVVVTVVVVVVVTAVTPAAGSTPSLRSRLGLGSQSRHPMRRRSDSQGA